MECTEQQQAVLDIVTSKKEEIVLVDAKAGTGKTATAKTIVSTIKPKRGLYTAFNKAIVTEGVETFDKTNMECKTLHALALFYVQPKLGIEPFTYLCIKESLSYPQKAKIIKAIDEFYRSSSVDAAEFLMEILDGDEGLAETAYKYVEAMFEDTMPVTFNYLLKHFHLLLHEGQIPTQYDLVILDEIQDSTAVALEIFKLLEAPYKVGLGDQFQSIYGFMNLVNGFEILANVATILPLSKTFRCSTLIASNVELYCQKHLSDDFTFEGIDNPVHDGKTGYITATNAMIIHRIIELHKEGRGYVLTRPLKEIFACPLALVTAAAGKKVMHKQYKFLDREFVNYKRKPKGTFYEYLNKETKDEEIKSSVGLLMHLNDLNINIFDVLSKAKIAKKDKNTMVGTFYSLKGLGFETVYIEDDINKAVKTAIEAKLDPAVEMTDAHLTNIKGGYVAATRARVNLLNAKFLKY